MGPHRSGEHAARTFLSARFEHAHQPLRVEQHVIERFSAHVGEHLHVRVLHMNEATDVVDEVREAQLACDLHPSFASTTSVIGYQAFFDRYCAKPCSFER